MSLSGGDSFGLREGDDQPLGEAILGDFGHVGGWLGKGLTVEGKAFEVKLEGFAEVGAHLFKRLASAGAAGNVGRKAAQIGWAVLVDDKVASRHGFNPACFRIL
jgi:hypothetical protein